MLIRRNLVKDYNENVLFCMDKEYPIDISMYGSNTNVAYSGTVSRVSGIIDNPPTFSSFIYIYGALGFWNPLWTYCNSYEGWCWEFYRNKIGTVSSEDCFVVGNYTNNGVYSLHVDTTSNYYSYIWSRSAQWATGTGAGFNSNQWYHVCYECYNNILSIYLNGELRQTYGLSEPIYLNTQNQCGIGFGCYNAQTLAGTALYSYLGGARFTKGARYKGRFISSWYPLYPWE